MTWFRLDDSFHSHPKVLAAGNAAVGLFVRCGTYSAEHLTEGFVPREVALMYGTPKLAHRLVDVGLWKPSEIGPGGWVMPDYLDYNPSREQVHSDRAGAAERQRRARERARELLEKSRVTQPVDNGPPGPSRPIVPSELKTPTSEPSSDTEPGNGARPDVEELCQHLADRIEANGSKRPTVTKGWRDACRRLIDLDGRTAVQVRTAIDWCQDDEFWRANVLSMPKLRERYDALRLAAQRPEARAGPHRHQAFRNPTNPDEAYGGQL